MWYSWDVLTLLHKFERQFRGREGKKGVIQTSVLSRTFFFQSECKLIANHVLYTVMRTMLVAMIKKQQNVCVSVKLLRRNSHSRRTVLALKRRTAGKGGKWRENHAVTTWLDQCLRSSRNRGRGRGSGKKWEKKGGIPPPPPPQLRLLPTIGWRPLQDYIFEGGGGVGNCLKADFLTPRIAIHVTRLQDTSLLVFQRFVGYFFAYLFR